MGSPESSITQSLLERLLLLPCGFVQRSVKEGPTRLRPPKGHMLSQVSHRGLIGHRNSGGGGDPDPGPGPCGSLIRLLEAKGRGVEWGS